MLVGDQQLSFWLTCFRRILVLKRNTRQIPSTFYHSIRIGQKSTKSLCFVILQSNSEYIGHKKNPAKNGIITWTPPGLPDSHRDKRLNLVQKKSRRNGKLAFS
jgi:hypothetical protein